MEIFVITFAAFLIFMAAMSIGVMMGRRPIAGTCGGISALGLGTSCEICGGDPLKCERERAGDPDTVQSPGAAAGMPDLAYDATRETSP